MFDGCSSNQHGLSVTRKVRRRNLTLTYLTHTCQHRTTCLPPLLMESSGPHSLPAGLSAHSAPLLVLLSAERSGRHGAGDRLGEPRSLAKKSKCSQWEWVVQLSESGFQLWHAWQIATNTSVVSTLWWSRGWNMKLAKSHTLLSALDVIHFFLQVWCHSVRLSSANVNLNVI